MRLRSAIRLWRSAAHSVCRRPPPPASSVPSDAASPRPTTTRSQAQSRPTPRSTRATRAGRCLTPPARCSASTIRSRPAPATAPASASPPRATPTCGREHDHRGQEGRASVRRRVPLGLLDRRWRRDRAPAAAPARQRPVVAGSPAAKAGLQAGDTITEINGRTIANSDGFISAISTYKPGDTVTLTVREPERARPSRSRSRWAIRPATAPTAG